MAAVEETIPVTIEQEVVSAPATEVSPATENIDGEVAGDDGEEEGITIYRDNIVTDQYGEEQCYNTDNEFLDLEPVDWHAVDKYNLPESELFLGCSVELSLTFFAKLNKDEDARMEVVKGIRRVVRRRDCIFDV